MFKNQIRKRLSRIHTYLFLSLPCESSQFQKQLMRNPKGELSAVLFVLKPDYCLDNSNSSLYIFHFPYHRCVE